ncbi:unnamed protein product, partial [Durusdinium trenchii]
MGAMVAFCSRIALLPMAFAELQDVHPELFRWVMTWPQGKRSVSKMSDFDLALDPSCHQQHLSAVDWRAVRRHVQESLAASEDIELRLRQWIGNGRPSGSTLDWGHCRVPLQRAIAAMGSAWDIDSRYSSWRSDCYLGWLSAHLSDTICSLHGALLEDEESRRTWSQKWTKTQLELEGLFFYVDLPWHVMLLQSWPLAQLLAVLGRAVSMVVGDRIPNLCDKANHLLDEALLVAAGTWWKTYHPKQADTPLLPLHMAEEFLAVQAAAPLLQPDRCSFGVIVALLSVALWAFKAGNFEGFPDGPVAGRSPEVLVSGNAQQMAKLWEERSSQFFFDLLTTRWRVVELLEQVAAAWPRAEPPTQQRLAQPSTRRMLFLGGGDTTYQWGSFTVRGRQLARGFRQQGLDARAWNSPCQAWCANERDWSPTSFVHVKYVCVCALLGWPHAAHIYDPVDVFGMPDNITLLDAVLVQTSLAKSDLEEHPPLKALKTQVSVHWLPLHHSNAHELRASPWERVHRVGVHTVHTDKDLEGLVTEVLAAHSDEAGLPPDERPHFVHMDPGKLFEPNEGKITTPQHTDALYQQLTTLQIGFAKQSGCLSEWWSCSRWKTGQRLVNMLSVGIPTIVWGDARGHLDIVEGLWPDNEEHGCTDHNGLPEACYPQELVIWSDAELPRALKALLQNTSLREKASQQGLKLASRFALHKMVHHLNDILLQMEARKAAAEKPWQNEK